MSDLSDHKAADPERPDASADVGRALYVHGGMPRTATSAVQTLLSGDTKGLQEARFIYPEAGRDSGGIAHHDLMLDIVSADACKPLVEEFMASLEHIAEDVIISSEAAIYGFGTDRRPQLLNFLRAAKQQRPTYFIYALRRMDEYCESVYIQKVRSTDFQLTLDQDVDKAIASLPSFFSALHEINETLGGNFMRLLRFHKSSDYIDLLLDSLGLNRARYAGSRVPRVVNETFSLKGQIALTHHRKLSAELGFDVRRSRLWIAVQQKILHLRNDRSRYHLMDQALAERIHVAALEAAKQIGCEPYLEFFEHAPPVVTTAPVTLDYDQLTQEDKHEIKQTLLMLVERHGLENSPKYND